MTRMTKIDELSTARKFRCIQRVATLNGEGFIPLTNLGDLFSSIVLFLRAGRHH